MRQHAQFDAQLAEPMRPIFQAPRTVDGRPRIPALVARAGPQVCAQASRSSPARTGAGGAPASPENPHDAPGCVSTGGPHLSHSRVPSHSSQCACGAGRGPQSGRPRDGSPWQSFWTSCLDGWSDGPWALAPTKHALRGHGTWRLSQRHPPAGLLHHPDRGSQETSPASQALLAEQGVIVRRSRPGKGFRSCGHRVLLRNAQRSVDGSRVLSHADRGEAGSFRIRRVLLSSSPTALLAGFQESRWL